MMFTITKPRFAIAKNSDGAEYIGCKMDDRGKDYMDTFPRGVYGRFHPPFSLSDAKEIAEQAYALGRVEALAEARKALGIE